MASFEPRVTAPRLSGLVAQQWIVKASGRSSAARGRRAPLRDQVHVEDRLEGAPQTADQMLQLCRQYLLG